MNPLILSYDDDRELWVVRDGKEMNWLTDGALMSKLDEFRDKVRARGPNGKSPIDVLVRFRRAWDRRMQDIVIINHRIYDRKFDADVIRKLQDGGDKQT